MELKEFIRSTIVQIVEGVVAANGAIEQLGGIVNPKSMRYLKDGQQHVYPHPLPQEIVFDVALTKTGEAGSSEGVGVFLGTINLGKKNDSKTQEVAVTSVRFTVPLVLPAGKELVEKSEPKTAPALAVQQSSYMQQGKAERDVWK